MDENPGKNSQELNLPEAQTGRDWIEFQGKKLDYKVTAEYIPIYGDNDDVKALCYCTSYIAENMGENRPVTFAFNGKPGSASLLLHIGALAPKTLNLSGTGTDLPLPPFELTANPDTLLDLTDLVFIDPVGTGFSRGQSWEQAKEFWGVRQDIASVAEFIRTWMTRHRRWKSPLFVLGESYGGIRGSGLVKALQDLSLLPLGFIAVSPALSYGELNTTMLLEHHLVHTLPAMSIAAWYHQRLRPELQTLSPQELGAQVHQWATTEYLTFLWKGREATEEERQNCLEKLHLYTGLEKSEILAMNCRILHKKFAALLIKGQVLSVFDSRLTAPGSEYDGASDAHTFQLGSCCQIAFFDYFQNLINLPESREYFASNQRYVGANWDFTSGYELTSAKGPTRAGGYISLLGDLTAAMRRYPAMKFFVGVGLFDIHCCVDTTRYCLNHMDLPESLQHNVTLKTYWGGHMYYSNPEAHHQFKTDLEKFYHEALNQ